MKNILLIGAGQLGSRHLQSIRNLTQPLKIFVVDPNQASLTLTEQRYSDSAPGAKHEVSYHTSFDQVTEKTFNACVIATNSDHRFEVFRDAIQKFKIENCLMEKILFDTATQYREAKKLAEAHNCNSWVNLCMRMQDPYFALKADIAGAPFHYRVTGGRFGLITNAIHFLDHAAFLNSSNEFVTDTSKLAPLLLESKRRGFHELTGELRFQFKNGSSLELHCYEESAAPILIEVLTPKLRFISHENENKFRVSREDNAWAWEEKHLGFKYQSQLTQVFLQQVLEGKEPALPRLAEATVTHLGMLQPLREFLVEKLNYNGAKEFPFT